MRNKELIAFKKKVREAVANYIGSEGCGCCESEDHDGHKEVIAKLLNVKPYSDGSGFDFSEYRSKDGK